jgi:hypothetical protein
MKTIIIAAAITAAAGMAQAQDAFITQMGDNLTGVNYSEYNQSGNTNRDNLQVIAQRGDGFSAANLARGSNNVANAYQLDLTSAYANGTGNSGATMESLIWQKGGFGTGENTAVAVQLANQSPGTQGTYTSQIIQNGTKNTGINWAQNAGGAMASATLGAITPPTVTFNTVATTPPTPAASTGYPFGSTMTVN